MLSFYNWCYRIHCTNKTVNKCLIYLLRKINIYWDFNALLIFDFQHFDRFTCWKKLMQKKGTNILSLNYDIHKTRSLVVQKEFFCSTLTEDFFFFLQLFKTINLIKITIWSKKVNKRISDAETKFFIFLKC